MIKDSLSFFLTLIIKFRPEPFTEISDSMEQRFCVWLSEKVVQIFGLKAFLMAKDGGVDNRERPGGPELG